MADLAHPPASVPVHLRRTVTVGAGRALSIGLNLLVLPVLLRFLSPADFGAYSLLQVAALMYAVVLGLGLPAVLMSRYAEAEKQPGGVASLLGSCLVQQFVMGGGLLVLGVLLSPAATALLVGAASPLVLPLLLASKFAANAVLCFARWQILSDRHGQLSVTAVVRSLLYFGAALVLVAAAGLGLRGLALAECLADGVALGLSFWLARGQVTLSLSRVDIGSTLRLGLPAAPDTLFYWLTISMPLYFLQRSGLPEAAGAFGLAWRLAGPIDSLGNSLATGAAHEFLNASRTRITRAARRLLRVSVGLLGWATAALVLLGPEIGRLAFPRSYQGMSTLLPLVALGHFFLGLYYFEWIGLSGLRRTAGLSVASGTAAVVGLAGFAATGFRPSALEASAAFACAFLAMWLTARAVRPGPPIRRSWDLVLGGVGTVGLAACLNALPMGWSRVALKLCVLMVAAVACGGLELLVRLRERRDETGGIDRFLDIPTYGEVTRLIDGGDRVLDVGCSEGFFLSELDAKVRVGVERDWARVRQGAKARPDIHFVCADAQALPFRPGLFDRVTLIGVLPYVADPGAVMEEAREVLEPGGRLVASAASQNPIFRLLSPHAWRTRLRYFHRDELSALLETAGFAVTSLEAKGDVVAPTLSVLYTLPSWVDRRIVHSESALGPVGRWARALTNPLIRWEYARGGRSGYQLFIAGVRR